MSYEDFKKIILRMLEEKVSQLCQIELKEVRKNNGVTLDAVNMHISGGNLSPCIYLNEYYKDHMNGRGIDSIVDDIINTYENSLNQDGIQVNDVLNMQDFNYIKNNIYCKVVNAAMNEEMLAKVPHKRFLDLAEIYSLLCHTDDSGIGSVTILNDHFDRWNCTLQELHVVAIKNSMQIFPSQIRSMEDVLSNMLGTESLCEEGSCQNQHSMFVLSNTHGINGASTMLYSNLMKQFISGLKNKPERVVILPSSIHEGATR